MKNYIRDKRKYKPKLLFAHFVWNVFNVLFSNGSISFEDGFSDVRGQIVFQAIGSVSLGLDVGQKGAGNTHILLLRDVFVLGHHRSGMLSPKFFSSLNLGDDQVLVQLQQTRILRQ